jgi:alkyl hydroperoxide reductase subunit AhpF
MAVIDEALAAELRKAFAGLSGPVRLLAFAQAEDSPVSEQVQSLVAELALLDEHLSCETLHLAIDGERAALLGIERVPAVAVLGGTMDFGVRFYGVPGGYEFGTLVDAVVDVSRGDSGLAADTRAALSSLDREVRIRVFSTPT